MSNNTTDLKSFHYLENGRVTFSMLETEKTVKKMDSGLYSLYKSQDYSNPEIVLTLEEPSEIHDLIRYPFIEKIDTIFEKFFDANVKAKVADLNYKHKLGLILHGVQGTAKTSILKHYYIKAIKEHNALAFYFTSDYSFPALWDFISKVRKVQDNPIVIYLDEFDNFFPTDSREEIFKTIMDGHLSIDNCIFLAATNHLHKIPTTILDRPSRLKYSFEVGGLTEELSLEFFRKNWPLVDDTVTEEEMKELAKESVGKTVDEHKEIVLDKIMDIEGRKSGNRKKIGFQSGK